MSKMFDDQFIGMIMRDFRQRDKWRTFTILETLLQLKNGWYSMVDIYYDDDGFDLLMI